ncbi:hypothetical protein GGS23DRAFT_171563 [Durotheca rogersii]|uniref:uncharacterized protein n=1 Tax=Durotheca rogersii TaxID=419775 RepID=UPI00221E788A|nr:uncharacterized protein GGS23DRAFT_171563 [Durotheca rogersii]KAI5867334.1 hypothetical protein GGS23DRAFT_171563 [Durotheca rogersii]
MRIVQQGPAGIQLPSYPSSSLPEMACFDPSACSCLCYARRDKSLSGAVPPNRPSFFRDATTTCRTYHTYNRDHGLRGNDQRVVMGAHWPRGKGNSVCLTTSYQRDILVCHRKDRGRINPTHAWLHGMDPDT